MVIANNVPRKERHRLPPLKGVDKHKLDALIQKANIEIANMEIESLDTLNDIAYATAAVITTEMGFKIQQRRKEESRRRYQSYGATSAKLKAGEVEK